MTKKNKQQRITFKTPGLVKEISKVETLTRTDNPDIIKKVLTIEMADGQIFYADFINSKMELLKKENIKVNNIVEVEFSFKGTNPSTGKRFNNIFAQNIRKIKV